METDVITIDGPTSSGKNSVGFLLAQKLGYQYIDSGSIYRAGCIFVLRNNIDPYETQKVVEIFKNLKIDIKNDNGSFKVIANNEDVT
ncbi:MAG: (d)CMP kinase, partial [Patescibacteria group bacterium]